MAADRLHLRVLTPERQLVDADVKQVTAPGALGEIGILPDHAALFTALDEGVLSYAEVGGAVGKISVTGGFAEVRDNVVTVLADAGTQPLS
jgi:F-type H+-transporting ATPase subunit epsilon